MSIEEKLITQYLDISPDKGFPKYLYHYTSIDGFMGIIDSKKIWASNIKYLNDKDEFIHTVKLLEERLKKIFKGRSTNKFRKALFELLKGSDISDDFDIYVFSLTEEGDLLSQWRGYCPNYGLSIGFEFSALKRCRGPHIFPTSGSKIFPTRGQIYSPLCAGMI